MSDDTASTPLSSDQLADLALKWLVLPALAVLVLGMLWPAASLTLQPQGQMFSTSVDYAYLDVSGYGSGMFLLMSLMTAVFSVALWKKPGIGLARCGMGSLIVLTLVLLGWFAVLYFSRQNLALQILVENVPGMNSDPYAVQTYLDGMGSAGQQQLADLLEVGIISQILLAAGVVMNWLGFLPIRERAYEALEGDSD